MKKILIALVAFTAGIACAVVYMNQKKTSVPVPAPARESAASQPASPSAPEEMAAPKLESPPPILESAHPPEKAPVAATVTSDAKPDAAAEAIHLAVDALLAAKNGPQKHELFQQLIKSGQIDAAITELKQRAADNPNDAAIPTTLGEALINKVGAIHAAGGDINEQGILAMQADQSFNAALKIDPQNFEAQLVKSISMTYWPAEPARDAQVVQTLSSLIDRQETMASRPDFAQTYIYLGNEYQKIGQPDKAQATWQLGLQKFPNDPTLQKKISGQ